MGYHNRLGRDDDTPTSPQESTQPNPAQADDSTKASLQSIESILPQHPTPGTLPSHIEKLLGLQRKDVENLHLKAQLQSLPNEFERLRKKIMSERNNANNSRRSLQEKQQQFKEVDYKMRLATQKIAQYKELMAQPKKQADEYGALEKELNNLRAQVELLEEEGLALIEQIQDDSVRLKRDQAATEKRLSLLEKEISTLERRKSDLEKQFKALGPQLTAAAEGLDPQYLCAYLKVKNTVKHPPFIVPLKDQQCSGCHLRVSNEVKKTVGRHEASVAYCDQCGRILY